MNFIDKLTARTAVVGIVGLGYVGLPLARAFTAQGVSVLGFDIDAAKVDLLQIGRSYIKHLADHTISDMRQSGLFEATVSFDRIAEVDAVIICVPTPLTKNREPDLGPVLQTGRTIAPYLKKGQLVVLESSTYPGTTDTELAAVLKESGLACNSDFFLAYSPEREDPGNKNYTSANIPKVVGADSDEARAMATALYANMGVNVVAVSNTRTAEAIKITENVFRAVNIALVNELKVIFTAMDIDVWEVINGAATKPFGFMPFYPGPGLGGHCIPIDPFYLAFKAREFGVPTRFIELAGEVNSNMPDWVMRRVIEALNERAAKAVNGSRILIIGVAYKPDVDDMRESPSLALMDMLEMRGASVDYHDALVPVLPATRAYARFSNRKSVELTPDVVSSYDLVLISTNHSNIDYQALGKHARIVVDTRNAMSGLSDTANVVKA